MRVFDIGAKDGPEVVGDRVLTVPNLLSLARIAILPVVYLDLVSGRFLRALVLLAVFASTDWFDGYIARRFDQVTRLGQVLDPLSDRILFVVVGIGLVVADLLPLWVLFVLLARDVVVLLAGAVLLGRGSRPPPVTRLGKAATFGLMWALPTLLLAAVVGDGAAAPQPLLHVLGWAMLAVSTVLYYLAAAGYGRTLLRRGR